MIDLLSDLFIFRVVSGHIRFDDSPGFIAEAVQDWIAAVGAKTAYITPCIDENVPLLAFDLLVCFVTVRIDAGPFFSAFHALAVNDGSSLTGFPLR